MDKQATVDAAVNADDRTYMITRDPRGEVHCRVGIGESTEFRPIKHVVKHSPGGFNFGYLGSGPADLALSILCDFFQHDPTPAELHSGNYPAAPLYQYFKAAFIATIPEFSKVHILKSDLIRLWMSKFFNGTLIVDVDGEEVEVIFMDSIKWGAYNVVIVEALAGRPFTNPLGNPSKFATFTRDEILINTPFW